ncbi:MAG: DUF3037 domain-containing protein [Deltaproteobacteria bacterium]|nr:DUF3037 domain-containing protein [Deltaproteobacteria bacterium]
MPAHAYNYALIRVVPRVERAEFINCGAVLHCHTLRYLEACVALDADRLRALAPGVDVEEVRTHLEAFCRICRGESDAGPIALLTAQERFYWLVAPRSTIIQTSPLHAGVTEHPADELARVMDRLVRVAR